jgi:hypothetical protein
VSTVADYTNAQRLGVHLANAENDSTLSPKAGELGANSVGKAATHRASSGPTRSSRSWKRTRTPSADHAGERS